MDLTTIITKGFTAFNEIGYKIIFANILAIFGIKSVEFPLAIAVLLIGSLFFMFTLRFINLTKMVTGIKIMLQSGGHGSHDASESSNIEQISPIRALLSTIAGAAGLGNIAGVAVAVSVGGPGAVFWMVMTPFLTMALRYAEVFSGHKYRQQNADGSFSGGPAYYMRDGLGQMGLPTFGKYMAIIYSFMLVISSFGGGCLFQSNQAIQVLTGSFGICCKEHVLLSSIFTAIIAAVVFGGIRRITGFLSRVVPILIAVYFTAGLIVIIVNYSNFLNAMSTIITEAFALHSIHGGMLGAFIIGFKRIIIANETGFGTAPIMHANSSNPLSVKEGIISMASPLIDTLFVCLMSAIIVVVTDVYKYKADYSGIMMTTKAFNTVAPWFEYIIIFMVPLMAMNVIIAWSYYGAKNCEYLFGKKSIKPYLLVYLLFVFFGGVIKDFDVVVKFTDIVNTGLAIPNVISLLLLSPVIIKTYNDYCKNKTIE